MVKGLEGVKDVRGEIPTFMISAEELREAHSNPDFRICVVTAGLTDPRSHVYTGPEFAARFDLEPLAYPAALRDRERA